MYKGKYFYYEELLKDALYIDIEKSNKEIDNILVLLDSANRLDNVENNNNDYNDLLNQIKSIRSKLITYAKIRTFIFTLSTLEQNLINLRYKENFQWGEMQSKINYSVTNIFRIKNGIFKKLKEYLEEDKL